MANVSEGSGLEADEDNETLDPAYLAHFSEHLNHVRSHLSGNGGTGRLSPSFFAPTGYWTSAEKDAFFHALIVHSRLRPDLIAEEVKTKTVVDVCVYLDLLEEGCANTPSAVQRKDLPTALEVSDDWIALEEQKALALVRELPMLEEHALQQSREEEIRLHKNALRARKGQARISSNERDREGEKRRHDEFKRWLEAREEEWKEKDMFRALDLASLKTMDSILREDDERQWFEARQSQVHKQDGETSLRVSQRPIDENMMNKGQLVLQAQQVSSPPADEEMIDPLLQAQSTSSPGVSLAPYEHSECTSAMPVIVHAPSHTLAQPHFRPSTPPFQTISLPAGDTSTSEPHTHTSYPVKGYVEPDRTAEISLSPAARRRLYKRLHMRRKRAQAKGCVVDETTHLLKPGRKRNVGKEGKGAEVSGLSGDNEVAVSSGYAGNADNRHANMFEKDTTHIARATPTPHDSPCPGNDELLGGNEIPTRHPHQSGMTLPYKLRAKLEAMGLDAEKLYEEGLGLLHLGGLAKLMQLYNKLNDVPLSVVSQVSCDTIQLLHIHAVAFLTRLMHRAIVSAGQERLAKMHTKAWRLGDNQVITTANVEHALSLMGCGDLSKRTHFESLLHRLDLEAKSGGEDNEGGIAPAQSRSKEILKDGRKRARLTGSNLSSRLEDSGTEIDDAEDDTDLEMNLQNEDEDEDEDEDKTSDNNEILPVRNLPLHRAIFAPFIRLPPYMSSSGGPSEIVDPLSYMPWPEATLSSDSMEPIPDDELVVKETDVDALLAELLDEEELDKRDQMVEDIYEKGLWAKFSTTRTTGDEGPGAWGGMQSTTQPGRKRKRNDRANDDDGDGPMLGGSPSLRFREPDPHGAVKSKVYVLDSD
ncbi:hypothetical protein AcW1_007610 [Taiwanofungus camphoratus]|nr:hypothetical protein AcW2_007329 [Antrodia cinnamomea]KAI0947371.1 hypothetical protein AcV7_009814 [Antrodia cinnamomea]KAI0953377.1 hypothetical protein AcW1_007610 [Antrodia cinnamomea]